MTTKNIKAITEITCGGIESTNDSVCTERGNCTAMNSCSCNDYSVGETCESCKVGYNGTYCYRSCEQKNDYITGVHVNVLPLVIPLNGTIYTIGGSGQRIYKFIEQTRKYEIISDDQGHANTQGYGVVYGANAYVYGGLNTNYNIVTKLSLVTLTKTVLNTINTPETSRYHGASELYGSTMYLIGGRISNEFYDDVMGFNLENNTFFDTGVSLTSKVRGLASVVVGDNIIVYGGETISNDRPKELHYINMEGQITIELKNGEKPPQAYGMVMVEYNGAVYIIGGTDVDDLYCRIVYRLDVENIVFSPLNITIEYGFSVGSAAIVNSRIYIPSVNKFFVLDLETKCSCAQSDYAYGDDCEFCQEGYSGKLCKPNCFGMLANDTTICSAHGSCVALDTCECASNYYGANCSVSSCFNILSNETNVCSSHGSCVALDTCECTSNYGGQNCTIPPCFGVFVNDSSVCSSHGSCVGLDTCECSSNFYGTNCSITTCFNSLSNESTVCSSHGSCVALDTCKCSSNYYGANCSIPSCFNVLANESTVCSSHGSCVSLNMCECSSGYGGLNCSIPTCFDMLANETSVCSSHGSCVALDTCECSSNYYGANCSLTSCFDQPSLGSMVCSSHGSCSVYDTCTCDDGFSGATCDYITCSGINSTSPSVCTERGTCGGPNNCTCLHDSFGEQCENCPEGIFGAQCQYKCTNSLKVIPQSVDGRNGHFLASFNNSFYAFAGFRSEIDFFDVATNKFVQISDSGSVLLNGVYTAQVGTSVYQFGGYFSSSRYKSSKFNTSLLTFEQSSVDGILPARMALGAAVSFGNGFFMIGGQEYGSSGDVLNKISYYNAATNTLTDVNTLTNAVYEVSAEKIGHDLVIIYGGRSSRYSFHPDLHYYNATSNELTFKKVSNKPEGMAGVAMVAYKNYVYFYGGLYKAIKNSQKISRLDVSKVVFETLGVTTLLKLHFSVGFVFNNQIHFYGGLSIGISGTYDHIQQLNTTNTCECKNSKKDYLSNCTTCIEGYFGNDCSNTSCFGVLSNLTHVCSSHGSCVEYNNCDCLPNYSGSNCSVFKCSSIFSNDPLVCSSHGDCVDHNQCNCSTGYYGPECKVYFNPTQQSFLNHLYSHSLNISLNITTPNSDYTVDFDCFNGSLPMTCPSNISLSTSLIHIPSNTFTTPQDLSFKVTISSCTFSLSKFFNVSIILSDLPPILSNDTDLPFVFKNGTLSLINSRSIDTNNIICKTFNISDTTQYRTKSRRGIRVVYAVKYTSGMRYLPLIGPMNNIRLDLFSHDDNFKFAQVFIRQRIYSVLKNESFLEKHFIFRSLNQSRCKTSLYSTDGKELSPLDIIEEFKITNVNVSSLSTNEQDFKKTTATKFFVLANTLVKISKSKELEMASTVTFKKQLVQNITTGFSTVTTEIESPECSLYSTYIETFLDMISDDFIDVYELQTYHSLMSSIATLYTKGNIKECLEESQVLTLSYYKFMNLYVEQFQKNSRLFSTSRLSYENSASIEENRKTWISSFKQLISKSDSIVFSTFKNVSISNTFTIVKQSTSYAEVAYQFSYNLTLMNESTINAYKKWFSLEQIPSESTFIAFSLSPSPLSKGDKLLETISLDYTFIGSFPSSFYSCHLFDIRSSQWTTKYCQSSRSSSSKLTCTCTFSISSSSSTLQPSFSFSASPSYRSQPYYVNVSVSPSPDLVGALVSFFLFVFIILFTMFLSCLVLYVIYRRKKKNPTKPTLPLSETSPSLHRSSTSGILFSNGAEHLE